MDAVLNWFKPHSARQRAHAGERLAQAGLVAMLLVLGLFLAAPLASILVKSVQDPDGSYVGAANFLRYLGTPSLLTSLWHSVWVSVLVTLIAVPLAFVYAYALARSALPF